MTSTNLFESKYLLEQDPWGANNPEQREYYDELLFFCTQIAPDHVTSILDIGCGEGVFTNQLSTLAKDVSGVDISGTAINRAQKSYPKHDFLATDLRKISDTTLANKTYDFILCSQVLYYFKFFEIEMILKDIEDLISTDGVVVLAANCSGGEWFTKEYFTGLCELAFDNINVQQYKHHVFFAGRKKKISVAVTIDYETIEHAKQLKLSSGLWESTVFTPCNQLLTVAEKHNVKLTFFAELAQYWFLEKYSANIAEKMAKQWKDIVRRGHDVQVHLHPRWLLKNNAYLDGNDEIQLSVDKLRLHDMSLEDIKSTLENAQKTLNSLLQPIDKNYKAICFRAGKYQIQPHNEIFEIFSVLGFIADSSVWHGGFLNQYDGMPGFDFRSLWHEWMPYFPDKTDLCIPSIEVDSKDLIEIPILSENRTSWCFDYLSSRSLIELFQRHNNFGGPRIMIGHTKALNDTVLVNLGDALEQLKKKENIGFDNMRDIAIQNHEYLVKSKTRHVLLDAINTYIPSTEEMYKLQSQYHLNKIDIIFNVIKEKASTKSRVRILDVGCGTGEYLALPLSHLLEKNKIEGYSIIATDIDESSINRAKKTVRTHNIPNIVFSTNNTDSLDDKFDIVICSEVLQYVDIPEDLVTQLFDRLADGGDLIVTVSNGYGYREIEKKVFNALLLLLAKMPSSLRSQLIRMLRLLRRKPQKNSPSNTKLPSTKKNRELKGTLNYENNVSLQCFNRKDIYSIFSDVRGFIKGRNIQLVGGYLGSLLECRININKYSEFFPLWSASRWLFLINKG